MNDDYIAQLRDKIADLEWQNKELQRSLSQCQQALGDPWRKSYMEHIESIADWCICDHHWYWHDGQDCHHREDGHDSPQCGCPEFIPRKNSEDR